MQYTRDRVGVKFPMGTCAVRPERLTFMRAARSTDDGATSSEDEKSNQKEGGLVEEATNTTKHDCPGDFAPTNVMLQQAQQLALSFVEAVMNDVLPLDEERPFWGFAKLGEDMACLNDVVLNAWTGLLRFKLLTEDILAKALVHGRVRPFFEAKCRIVMQDSKFPEVEGMSPGTVVLSEIKV